MFQMHKSAFLTYKNSMNSVSILSTVSFKKFFEGLQDCIIRFVLNALYDFNCIIRFVLNVLIFRAFYHDNIKGYLKVTEYVAFK